MTIMAQTTRMGAEKPVRLRVVDESGVAVKGAFISVLRSTVPFPEISLITGENGVVKTFLPYGKFVIGVDAPENRHVEVEFDNTSVDTDEEVLLILRLVE